MADCIDSVINQSLKNIEIIGVYDGGTDNSYSILKKYAQRDKKIRIINYHANRGLSYARNRGLEAAKRKYIFFLILMI